MSLLFLPLNGHLAKVPRTLLKSIFCAKKGARRFNQKTYARYLLNISGRWRVGG